MIKTKIKILYMIETEIKFVSMIKSGTKLHMQNLHIYNGPKSHLCV